MGLVQGHYSVGIGKYNQVSRDTKTLYRMDLSRILLFYVATLLLLHASSCQAFSFSPSSFRLVATKTMQRRLTTTQIQLSMSSSSSSSSSANHILYDLPVSNNGARCRLILYKKEIPEQEVEIVSPAEVGGLNSEEFLQINPQGKMPALVVQVYEANQKYGLAESDTIARYFMSQYIKKGPTFQPLNPLSNLLARFHDMYLTTIQGCLYKPSPPFGVFGTRQDALVEFQHQLEVLEELAVDEGLYLCGPEISYADATIFPTLVFAQYMMPKFIKSCPSLAERGFEGTLPPKLAKYYNNVKEYDPVFAKIYDEVSACTWHDIIRYDTRHRFRCYLVLVILET